MQRLLVFRPWGSERRKLLWEFFYSYLEFAMYRMIVCAVALTLCLSMAQTTQAQDSLYGRHHNDGCCRQNCCPQKVCYEKVCYQYWDQCSCCWRTAYYWKQVDCCDTTSVACNTGCNSGCNSAHHHHHGDGHYASAPRAAPRAAPVQYAQRVVTQSAPVTYTYSSAPSYSYYPSSSYSYGSTVTYVGY